MQYQFSATNNKHYYYRLQQLLNRWRNPRKQRLVWGISVLNGSFYISFRKLFAYLLKHSTPSPL